MKYSRDLTTINTNSKTMCPPCPFDQTSSSLLESELELSLKEEELEESIC
jgi:hypothetical protein